MRRGEVEYATLKFHNAMYATCFLSLALLSLSLSLSHSFPLTHSLTHSLPTTTRRRRVHTTEYYCTYYTHNHQLFIYSYMYVYITYSRDYKRRECAARLYKEKGRRDGVCSGWRRWRGQPLRRSAIISGERACVCYLTSESAHCSALK